MLTPPPMMNRLADLQIQDRRVEAHLARQSAPSSVPVRVRSLTLAARLLRVEHQLLFESNRAHGPVTRSAH